MKAVIVMLHDDGSFMVQETAAPAEPMEGETFASAEEAMQAAMEMLRGAGAGEEEQAAAMQGGYNKVAGNKMQPAAGGGDSVAAMFGE